jgi:hypothetical protein
MSESIMMEGAKAAFPILWIMVPNHYSGNDYGKKKYSTPLQDHP